MLKNNYHKGGIEMKRFIVFLGLLSMVMLLTACGGEEDENIAPVADEFIVTENIEVIINILEGGKFSIIADESLLTVDKQPSSLYPELDYVINTEGTITNILYNYNVCFLQIHNFEAMIDSSIPLSELIGVDMPTLLPPTTPENFSNPPRKGFSLKFRTSKKPTSSIRISFGVSARIGKTQ